MRTRLFAPVAALGMVLAGCVGDPEREADRPYTAGFATVERVHVENSSAIVIGTVPDACTRIDRIDQQVFGSRLEITIHTRRPSASMCAAALQTFHRTIALDLAGVYESEIFTVEVNGVSARMPMGRSPYGDAILDRLDP